ncbi:MAG: hypothetical protein ABI977_38115 [Acidobacteriota bacterium]
MIVMFPADIEKRIIALAAQQSIDPASFDASLVEKELRNELALAPVNGFGLDDDCDPEAGKRAVAALANRTPERIKAAQERAIKEFRPKRELPLNLSPLEVMPVIRGNETDEEVLQALKELS